MQAVAAEKPQQVTRDQVGYLRVAMEHLTDHVLPHMALFGHVLQVHDQFIEAFEEQCMAFFGYLFGFPHGQQNAAQMGQKCQVVIVIGIAHGSPVSG